MTAYRLRLLSTLDLAAFVSACASKDLPPDTAFDEVEYTPAALEGEPPRPIEIVSVPEPLPLPGQLKPLPGKEGAVPRYDEKGLPVDIRPPEERVTAANEAAVEPTEDGYVNAIQVYPYTEGALYQVYTSPEQVSDIALQRGETITAVSAGDTLRWVVGDTVSGSGENARAHVLIKPTKEDLKTNLVIITDRRSYHLELRSTPETYMASASWRYPRDELLALERRNAVAEQAAEQVFDRGLRVDPEALALRARPRPVTRINRRVLILLAGTGMVLVLGATLIALDPPSFSGGEEIGTELIQTRNVPRPDGLEALPRRYSDIAPEPVPQLGPPLPGDLGPAIIERERELGIEPSLPFRPSPEDDAERAKCIRQARLAQQARESGVFFQRTTQTGQTGLASASRGGEAQATPELDATAGSRNPFELAAADAGTTGRHEPPRAVPSSSTARTIRTCKAASSIF